MTALSANACCRWPSLVAPHDRTCRLSDSPYPESAPQAIGGMMWLLRLKKQEHAAPPPTPSPHCKAAHPASMALSSASADGPDSEIESVSSSPFSSQNSVPLLPFGRAPSFPPPTTFPPPPTLRASQSASSVTTKGSDVLLPSAANDDDDNNNSENDDVSSCSDGHDADNKVASLRHLPSSITTQQGLQTLQSQAARRASKAFAPAPSSRARSPPGGKQSGALASSSSSSSSSSAAAAAATKAGDNKRKSTPALATPNALARGKSSTSKFAPLPGLSLRRKKQRLVSEAFGSVGKP